VNSNKDGIASEVDGRLDDLFGDRGGAEDGNPRNEKIGADSRGPAVSGGKKIKQGSSQGSSLKSEKSHPNEAIINELKSVVLSLEWEITDQVMDKLAEEIEKLKVSCKDDKIIVAFLQLIDSLGKYIQKKKAEAHPDSISLLNSVYGNLETVMLSEGMSEADKKKVLVTEVNKYKELKVIIASDKSDKPSFSVKEEKQPEKPKPRTEEKTGAGQSSAPAQHHYPVSEDPAVAVMPDDDDDDEKGLSFQQQELLVRLLKDINRTLKDEFKALREELKRWRESQGG